MAISPSLLSHPLEARKISLWHIAGGPYLCRKMGKPTLQARSLPHPRCRQIQERHTQILRNRKQGRLLPVEVLKVLTASVEKGVHSLLLLHQSDHCLQHLQPYNRGLKVMRWVAQQHKVVPRAPLIRGFNSLTSFPQLLQPPLYLPTWWRIRTPATQHTIMPLQTTFGPTTLLSLPLHHLRSVAEEIRSTPTPLCGLSLHRPSLAAAVSRSR